MGLKNFVLTHCVPKLCLALLVAGCLSEISHVPLAASPSVVLQVETLGTPFTQKGVYARNVWDMQLFNNRIYFGHGNSSNFGPDSNAGPIPIWYYDIAKGIFVNEFTVDEEQIDVYHVLDNKLYTPGNDPRNTSNNGDAYRLDANGWTKFTTIPNAYHTYDMALFQGKLFVGNGTIRLNSVMMSSDNGATWKSVLANNNRTYKLFQFHNKLYAMQWIKNTPDPVDSMFFVFNGTQFVSVDVAGPKIFPGSDLFVLRMVRPTEFQNQLVYIASDDGVNDHQWNSHGLYVAPELDQGRHVVLPEQKALPYDILIRGNTLYILAAVKQTNSLYSILVYKTSDLNTWTEVLRFDAATFARSFEESLGSFYFGLGSNDDVVSPATGTILRVRIANPPAVTPTITPVSTPTRTATSVPTTTGVRPSVTPTFQPTATVTVPTTIGVRPSATPTFQPTATVTVPVRKYKLFMPMTARLSVHRAVHLK